MAITCVDGDNEIHQALCVRHPNCKDLHFCFECSLVLCADCRKVVIESVNHLQHSTVPLKEAFNQRWERMTQIQKLMQEYHDYSLKHDIALEAILKLKKERKSQLENLNGIIDEYAAQLCHEVETMKNEAKHTIEKRADAIWAENPEGTLQKEINLELRKMRDVLSLIDHEVRLCDRDELYLVEKNKEIEKLAGELSEFQQRTFQIPDKSCDRLSELRNNLRDHMDLFQSEFTRSKDGFLKWLQTPAPFPHPDQLSLVKNDVVIYPNGKFVLPIDQDKSPVIRGVCPTSNKTDAIYLVDRNNSKIKHFDLKTSQLTEVFAGPSGTKLFGLANVSDNPVEPLIATTEHTEGPQARVCTLFLRNNAVGKLDVVQRVVLHENRSDRVTFARWPAGNLFCAVLGSDSLYELCRSRNSSHFPYEDAPHEHRLPANARYMCGLHSIGECRIAASLDDNTLRVFRVAGGSLSELQCVPLPQANWEPNSLVALPGGSLIVRSWFSDPVDKKGKQGIECCAAKPDGTLAAPKLLLAQEVMLNFWGLLPPTDAFPTYRLAAFNLNREFCLYPIHPQ